MTDAVGRPVAELETPVLVADLDRVERNVARVAAYAAEHGLALWPHAKTHKTAALARRQLAAGARGLTVAKSGEAAAYARHGIGPLLLHYPAFGADKWRRLADVAGEQGLTVALDSVAVAEGLSDALRARGTRADVLIELDAGMRRTGVAPEQAGALAQAVERLDGLDVVGISCYPGHVRGSADEVRAGLRAVDERLRAAVGELDAAGVRRERVSGGSTATLFEAHETAMTEIRPGNYVFLDRSEGRDAWAEDDCALHVHATVVSTSVPGRMVLDAGAKTLGESVPPAGLRGWGAVVGAPDVTIAVLNEEHAVCELTPGARAPSGAPWAVGDRVAIVPNHACTCVNLHDRVHAAREGVVEEVWPLIARGAVR